MNGSALILERVAGGPGMPMGNTERVNRAIADCLILCAYSHQNPYDSAQEFVDALRGDPLWSDDNVNTVASLVFGVLDRLSHPSGNGKQ
jgi:hypothetical protein